MSDMNIHYENRKKILDEMKLSNPSFSKDLYEKIMRLLNYRKYYEETDNHIILESLPYSLRNSLIMEMYKPFINNFKFFKNIKNRDFIVQVVSKLKPVLAVKGDILVQEGDFIEDIMFVKEGVLSLEIQIDLDYPDKCIEEYLNKNKILTVIEPKDKVSRFNQQTKNFLRDNEITSKKLYKSKFLEAAGTNIYPKKNILDILNKTSSNFSSSEDNDNVSFIKILRIRKNEHFGDVFMFLNNRSPLYVRVGSKKVELLILKKLDAVSISTTYPGLWKKVIAKSLINTKKIKNLTLKMLIIFCNFHGIKTKFFKQQKYCLNDIKCMLPNSTTITNDFKFTKKKMLPLNNEIENSLLEISRQSEIEREFEDDEDKTEESIESEDSDDEKKTENKKEITDVIYEEQDEGSLSETSINHISLSPTSKKNKSKPSNSRFKSSEDLNNLKSISSENKKENFNKRKTVNIPEKKRKVDFTINNTQIKNKDKSFNNVRNLANKTTIEQA
jgi:CRP-like cAMP-binding protein